MSLTTPELSDPCFVASSFLRRIGEITNAVEGLQVEVRAISNEIHGNNSFLTKTIELRRQLDECSKRIHALLELKSRILGQARDFADQRDGLNQEIQAKTAALS